jgi:hypothetical protein
MFYVFRVHNFTYDSVLARIRHAQDPSLVKVDASLKYGFAQGTESHGVQESESGCLAS